MKVAVIGTGYVGLVAGACFADTGNDVICVDKDQSKIDKLLQGEIPIYEPGLEDLVQRNAKEGRLKFTVDTAKAVADSEIIFLAVGTPPLPDGQPDLKYLKAAAEEVGAAMKKYCIVVNKSTVPIGAHLQVSDWIRSKTTCTYDVISNPEFLKEGTAVDDFLKPDRVIIGTVKKDVFEKMQDLYSPFVRQGNPIIWMDPVSAEMTKYACNSFLATRISFMNEMSVLCEAFGGNIEMVRKGMITDHRIGRHFLYAGVGYGGSCFPKDVQALISKAKEVDVPMGIVQAAEDANARQKVHLVKKIREHFNGNIQGKKFAVWGIAFKPNTDDIREAPSMIMMEELLKQGASVSAFDPVAMDNARAHFGDKVNFVDNAYEALEGADGLILVTEWNEFRHPDFNRMKSTLKEPTVFDGRNVYVADKIRALGFKYYGIGVI